MYIAGFGMWCPGRQLRARSGVPVAWVTDRAFYAAGMIWADLGEKSAESPTTTIPAKTPTSSTTQQPSWPAEPGCDETTPRQRAHRAAGTTRWATRRSTRGRAPGHRLSNPPHCRTMSGCPAGCPCTSTRARNAFGSSMTGHLIGSARVTNRQGRSPAIPAGKAVRRCRDITTVRLGARRPTGRVRIRTYRRLRNTRVDGVQPRNVMPARLEIQARS
jgi:hypothetical protein